MRYYVQRLSPNGENWVDVMGSDNVADCKAYAKHLTNQGGPNNLIRVIERRDRVIK